MKTVLFLVGQILLSQQNYVEVKNPEEEQARAEEQARIEEQARLDVEVKKNNVMVAKKEYIERVDVWISIRFTGKVAEMMYNGLLRTEKEFVEACKACASSQVCEEDRRNIRRGEGSLSYNPCE